MYEGHARASWRASETPAWPLRWTSRISSVMAMANTPSLNASSRPVSTAARGGRAPPLRMRLFRHREGQGGPTLGAYRAYTRDFGLTFASRIGMDRVDWGEVRVGSLLVDSRCRLKEAPPGASGGKGETCRSLRLPRKSPTLSVISIREVSTWLCCSPLML